MNKLMNLLIVILLLGLGLLGFSYRDAQSNLKDNLQQCKEEAEPYEIELAMLENELKQTPKNTSDKKDKDQPDKGNKEMVLVGYLVSSITDFSAVESVPFDDKIDPVIILDCNAGDALLAQVAESDYSCILCNATDEDSLAHAAELTGSKSYLLRGNQISDEDLTSALDRAGIENRIGYIRSLEDGKTELGYSFISSNEDSVKEDYDYARSIHCPLLYVFDLNSILMEDGNLDHVTDSISYLVAGNDKMPMGDLDTALTLSGEDSDDQDKKDEDPKEKSLKEKKERIKELHIIIRDIYNMEKSDSKETSVILNELKEKGIAVYYRIRKMIK